VSNTARTREMLSTYAGGLIDKNERGVSSRPKIGHSTLRLRHRDGCVRADRLTARANFPRWISEMEITAPKYPTVIENRKVAANINTEAYARTRVK